MSAPNSHLLGLDDTELPDESRVGQVILGRYEIVRFIAAGGMGTVYEARHQRIGRRMAIKFLRRGLEDAKKTLARFEQEAVAAGALESENICSIVELGSAPDGVPCLVMEYVDGENLASLLDREGPLPIARAVDLVRQVCRGLNVAHVAHVVHRDLKPRNLIVCRRSDGTDLVKIVDFGIAKLGAERRTAATSTTTGSALGTPHYMSPEQARGDKQLDVRADIYALGVISYELLSAQKPHSGDSYNAIIYHILSKEPLPLRQHRPEVPAGLATVVHRAMATEARERFASVLELERALAPYARSARPRLAADADTASGDSSAHAVGRKPFWRRHALSFLSGAAVAAASTTFFHPQPQPAAETTASVVPKISAPTAPRQVAEQAPADTAVPTSSVVETAPSAVPAAGTPPVDAAVAAARKRQRVPAGPRPSSVPSASRATFDFANPYE